MISRSVRPREYIPTSQAATKPSAPMLIGNTVPTTNSATSASIETKTGDMCGPWVQGRQWPGVRQQQLREDWSGGLLA
jgi:hypothetical protein